jgi:hypothetical protein
MTTSQPTPWLRETTSAVESHKQADAAAIVDDAARSMPGEQTTLQNECKDGGTATMVQAAYTYRQLARLSWPTSIPGPEITPPPPGQYPLPGRTDQMIYTCYDQERGTPGDSLPTVPVQKAVGTRFKVSRNERKLP